MSERQNLWYPGLSLADEYPAATSADVATKLRSMTRGSGAVVELNILGALRTPDPRRRIQGVASIDLCEVVRGTARAMSHTAGHDYTGNNYLKALWDDARFNAGETVDNENFAYVRNVIDSLALVVTNHQLIRPVEGIETIREILHYWHQNGIFIVANTSTIAGNELSTLDFINTHLPGLFDGIVFPRNHDGNGRVTKADALKEVIDTLGTYAQSPTFALHIDDTPHHLETMALSPPHPTDMRLYAPIYEEDLAQRGIHRLRVASSPVGAFYEAHRDVLQQSVTRAA